MPFLTTVASAATTPLALLSQAAKSRPAAARPISPVVLLGLIRAVELTVLAGVGLASAGLAMNGTVNLAHSAVVSIAAAVLACGLFEMMGLYTLSAMRRPGHYGLRLAAGPLLAIAVVAVMLPGLLPGTWLPVWLVAGALALLTGRVALAILIWRWSRQGRLTRRAVVYGSGAPCQDLLKSLGADANSDIRICGIYDDRSANRGADQTGYPHHGGVDNLIGFARSANVDLVLLALPISAETRLMALLKQLWVLPADVRLVASASHLQLSPRTYSWIGDVALIALADRPISDWGQVAKSAFDRIIGSLALIALAPVMALTALAIKLDSKGPVLFRQKRYGFNNELIEVFKFRSMYTSLADQGAAKLVTRQDPRVTSVGRFIRKTSLDELPQLFNVLIGNLSLVGPRPHAVSAKAAAKLYDEVFDGYFARHKVKPGITGWAQVNGWRGETDTEDKLRHRVEHDLYYIANWSLLLDAWILLRTPLALLKTDNAY